MAYILQFYSLLRNDRDDRARAKVLDEWRELQPKEVQESVEESLFQLRNQWGLGEQQAKSLLCTLILFCHLKVDERDTWQRHGERLRAEWEWTCIKNGISFRVEALEPK